MDRGAAVDATPISSASKMARGRAENRIAITVRIMAAAVFICQAKE